MESTSPPNIPDKAVEAAHEVAPAWSVLYDTHKCKVCNTWAYQRDGEWKHGGAK